MIHLRPDIVRLFASERCVADFFAIDGTVAKERHRRRTVRFEREGRCFFIKCHYPVGWAEIGKNLLRGRLPTVGAGAERRAIQRLHEIGVPTMQAAGYGRQGWPAARQRSFIITDELAGIVSFEQLAQGVAGPPLEADLKRRLIRQMADLTRRLHRNGVNHRDLYLCHFALQLDTAKSPGPSVYVIDLHRVQCRARTPRRWIIKDLAALYFSSLDLPPARRDLLRFIRYYSDKPLRRALGEDRRLWRKVVARAEALYRKEWKKEPPSVERSSPVV